MVVNGEPVSSEMPASPLSDDELHRLDKWWRAANYLSVGQIYLWTIRCCARISNRSTSSLGCLATGARHRA